MQARIGCRAARGFHGPAQPATDAGFTLIEVMVSIAVISALMLSLSVFFVQSVSLVGQQRARQAAIQVADGAVELVRALPRSALADKRDESTTMQQWANPVAGVGPHLDAMAMAFDGTATAGDTPPLPFAETVKLNGVDYTRHWYLGRCWQPAADTVCHVTAVGAVPFTRVVVAVTWKDSHCATGLCAYVTATLVSTESDDAVFNVNESARPPTITDPSTQASRLSEAVSLHVTATGGSTPHTWSGTGLPDGLTLAPDGLITGTPTRAGTYPVTVTVVDSFNLTDQVTFSWTIFAPPSVTNPGAQSTRTGTAVSLAMAAGGGLAPLAWTANGLPAGLTVNAATGLISGTPGTTGMHSVTITVTDRSGATDSVSFAWAVTATSYSSLVLADGPLGYWRLGEAGGPTATDSSGNGWHGTYQGSPVFSRIGALVGNSDTAVGYNGVDTGMTAPDRNDFVGRAPFTIEAWVRPTSLGASSDYKTIARKYGGSGYWLWLNSSNGLGFQRMSTSGISRMSVGPLATGVWHHVVATYDGTTMRVYRNGVLRTSGTSTLPISDNTAALEVGFYPTLPSYTVTGDLDEVAIYGTALSAARITAHYEKGRNG